jgi:hypothetical protein
LALAQDEGGAVREDSEGGDDESEGVLHFCEVERVRKTVLEALWILKRWL